MTSFPPTPTRRPPRPHAFALLCMLSLAPLLFGAAIAAAETPAVPAAEGRFGQGLQGDPDIMGEFVHVPDGARFAELPITVELWARLDNADSFNILAACGPKEWPGHWEIYSYMGAGDLSVYLPGCTPAEVRTGHVITDGALHFIAMTLTENRITLFVDGRVVAEAAITDRAEATERPGISLGFGHVISNGAIQRACAGAIDDVRIRTGADRATGMPSGPLTADARTIGLWAFEGDTLEEFMEDASEHAQHARLVEADRRSLDEIDREAFNPGPAPLDLPAVTVDLHPGATELPDGPVTVSLDGTWELAEGGEAADRLGAADWADAIPATVPGSVHTALLEAGRIPDPRVGLNDAKARENSFKTWWMRRTFPRPEKTTSERLIFGGIAVSATVWLNGVELGKHDGMFGGPEYDISELIEDHNTLVVRIDPAPFEMNTGRPNDFFQDMNVGWVNTVVFNNVYGWHYSNIPALGIWRSVRIETDATVNIEHPFVATSDAAAGTVHVHTGLRGPGKGWRGQLVGVIRGESFDGPAYRFASTVASDSAEAACHVQFDVPDPRLWWPNGLGEPNLYRLDLAFVPEGGGRADFATTTFGIRTVEMAPLPGGPRADRYNWTFVINGRPIFAKGANWCTMDPLMDFSRERYERLFQLAHDQHVQMFRAWGSGMPETDAFYDLADRYGIMVMQEWPTAWNSHKWQPYDALEETMRLNTLRIRNHPSLVMWGGGNESDEPFGPAIDMMGRYAVELDGTRAFHRGEPWGGSLHNYNCYWGRQPLDSNLSLTGPFIGEFGIACYPVYETVQRYLPEDERDLWPPKKDGAFAYHTPVFNMKDCVAILDQYARYFSTGEDMEQFVMGSQLSQATGIRHTLELARTRWPECSGALYYKMNDNYPAASWASVDWYGAPKVAHYVVQDAFAPLAAFPLLETFNAAGDPMDVPVHLVDDADALAGKTWEVTLRAVDAALAEIKQERYSGSGAIDRTAEIGRFTLSAAQTDATPLFLITELRIDGTPVHRGFCWLNFEAEPGALFTLPTTRLEMTIGTDGVEVRNAGDVAAVGVCIERPDHADTFRASDGVMWLDPGASRTVTVNTTEGVVATAWNAPTER